MKSIQELKFTEDHEWIRVLEDSSAEFGITDFAQSELGDIVYVEVDTIGETLEQGEVFGTIEAVKAVSDLYCPISGEVTDINEALEDAPETVNKDPYGEGWMIKLKISDSSQLDDLLDAAAYKELAGE